MIPSAQGYGHHDGLLDVERRIFLVNDDGRLQIAPQLVDYSAINWSEREKYLVKFSAADGAGNQAEKLFLGMVLDDTQAPVIQIAANYPFEIEACDRDDPLARSGEPWMWQVPGARISAVDNVDGNVKETLSADPPAIDTAASI
jgi:hypothetical protein